MKIRIFYDFYDNYLSHDEYSYIKDLIWLKDEFMSSFHLYDKIYFQETIERYKWLDDNNISYNVFRDTLNKTSYLFIKNHSDGVRFRVKFCESESSLIAKVKELKWHELPFKYNELIPTKKDLYDIINTYNGAVYFSTTYPTCLYFENKQEMIHFRLLS